jgi:hypothetical protein
MNRIHPATLIGLLLLFLLAVGITAAAYFTLVGPEDRHPAFHSGLIASCLSELVFFVYLLYVIGAGPSPRQPDAANRLRLMAIIAFWMLVIIISGGIAAAPGNVETFFSQKILAFQLILTFLVFLAVFFQHRQAVVVQVRDAVPQAQRRRLESYAGGLVNLLADLRALAARHPDQLVEIEALSRRVDTVRTQLLSTGAVIPRHGRPVAPAGEELIAQRLGAVHDAIAALTAADPQQMAGAFAHARDAVEHVLSALRQRENTLTF